ncbi:hypothetical protein RSOLAG22IIIB_04074 [Rhizoctonia solani]|uniref:F-box domain-containing protein n=1 Tax=Rhizoctonia solani TaxID=456999 RepID=A0A0K6FU86_9AGAM|nr:hypothetical protein RSOLAG22IIIB_04074 [Rhizoctonia solani]
MSSSIPSRSTILDIPELVVLVCESAQPEDRARLLRVSKLFFYCTVPYIWNEIRGVTTLLKLIDGVTITSEKTDFVCSNTVIELDEHLDFTRFDFYAPLVHKLEVFHQRTETLTLNSWENLVARDKPLLPNLTRLSCREAPANQSHDSIIQWVNIFLTPDLVELRVPNPNGDICAMFAWLAPLLVSNMLQTVSTKCPSLKTLEVAPGTSSHNSPAIEFNVPLAAGLHEHIARFDSLRTLVTSAAALEPGMLVALSQLPKLEALSVVSSHQHEPMIRIQPLGPNAFPVLERLELRRLSLSAITGLWYTPGLVSKLSSAVIAQPILDEFTPRNWAGELISHVCLQSPALQEFYLDPYYYATQVVFLSHDNLKLLEEQQVPLKRITLCGTLVDRNVGVQDLARAFPHLSVLRLPSWRVTWQEARDLVARLPNLHTLSVGLDTLQSMVPQVGPPEPSRRNRTRLSLEMSWDSLVELSSDKMIKLAEFLYDTWPAVKCEVMPGLSHGQRTRIALQKLNGTISGLKRQSEFACKV